MGTRERREREMAIREQTFIDAAVRQISEQGLLSLQMARVARDCDYATGTLYQHFASKEDLLLAICADQANGRAEVFARVAEWQAPSRDRMFALAVGDMLFARNNPDHFRLHQYIFTEVVWRAASVERRQAVLAAHQPLGLAVDRIVRDAIESRDLQSRARPTLELALGQWSMTVGMHNLVHAEGLLDFFDLHEPYRILLRHIQINLNGLGWQPLFDNPFDDTVLDDKVEHICNTLFRDLCNPSRQTREPHTTTDTEENRREK